MKRCDYWDCRFCYAPKDVKTNATQGGCFEPKFCPYLNNKMTEKILYSYRTPQKHHVQYRDDDLVVVDGVVYQKVDVVAVEKPVTLYEKLSKSLDGMMMVNCDNRLKDTICTIVGNWLPDKLEHKLVDSYPFGWNDCLNHLQKTLK